MITIDNKFNKGDHAIFEAWVPSACAYMKMSGYVVGIKYIQHDLLGDYETNKKIPYRIEYAFILDKMYKYYKEDDENGKLDPSFSSYRFYWADEDHIEKIE